MDQSNDLNFLERSLHEAVSENLIGTEADSDVFAKKFMELFESVREECEQSGLQSHKDLAPKALAEIRKANAGFELRTLERWKPSFDHLEMMWSVAQELGEKHGKAIKEEEGETKDVVMAALAHIFPRALLVTQEIICLLKGGFPDGALARWRSLHELTVTAMYIVKRGEVAAGPYLLSFHFAARRAAHQLNEHSERAGIDEFSSDELAVFDELCAEVERLLGRKIDKDKFGEWPKITGTHPSFADIEKYVGMDHWRPHYKWASAHTHANHRPMDKLLGLAEGEIDAHLVGASNYGFVDPFQMSAATLAKITVTYLKHGVNADRLVHANIMLKLADEMQEIAIKNKRDTFKTDELS